MERLAGASESETEPMPEHRAPGMKNIKENLGLQLDTSFASSLDIGRRKVGQTGVDPPSIEG